MPRHRDRAHSLGGRDRPGPSENRMLRDRRMRTHQKRDPAVSVPLGLPLAGPGTERISASRHFGNAPITVGPGSRKTECSADSRHSENAPGSDRLGTARGPPLAARRSREPDPGPGTRQGTAYGRCEHSPDPEKRSLPIALDTRPDEGLPLGLPPGEKGRASGRPIRAFHFRTGTGP